MKNPYSSLHPSKFLHGLAGIFVAVATFICIPSLAQPTDEDGVKKCLENYMSGVGDRVELAFHPSATMKYIDNKTGEFKDVPIAEYIGRVKSNKSAPDRKIEIVYTNIEGTAAQAEIRIETDKAIMFDYMNLLKISGEWKIVSKIFTRKAK